MTSKRAVRVDTRGPNGELVQRYLIGPVEERFWEEVDGLMTHTADDLRVFAKSRRLVWWGLNKVELAKRIAMHDLMKAGDWWTASEFGAGMKGGFELADVQLEYIQESMSPTAEQLELVRRIRNHAQQYYEVADWDILVETWTDDDILNAIGRSQTFKSALYKVHAKVLLQAERRSSREPLSKRATRASQSPSP